MFKTKRNQTNINNESDLLDILRPSSYCLFDVLCHVFPVLLRAGRISDTSFVTIWEVFCFPVWARRAVLNTSYLVLHFLISLYQKARCLKFVGFSFYFQIRMATVDCGEKSWETKSWAQTEFLFYPKKEFLMVFALFQFGNSMDWYGHFCGMARFLRKTLATKW